MPGHQDHHSAPSAGARPVAGGRRGLTARIGAALSGATGAVAGLLPHLLHHIAPIAGAAILTGTAGSVLFGALGFALMIPMLLRLRRRFGSWLAPGVAALVFAAMFTVSTVWIGPAIRGDDNSQEENEQHDHGAALVHDPRFGSEVA